MTPSTNFLITIIAITLALVTSIIYIVLNVEPNIFWLIGMVLLCGITITLVFSIIFYACGKLRSFETPKEMYRRQLKKGAIFGILAMVLLIAQKLLDIVHFMK